MKSGESNIERSGSSLKALDALTPQHLAATLRNDLGVADHEPMFVAVSGGLDSVVLAHLISRLTRSPTPVLLHVNHGLHADADAWRQFVERLASTLDLGFDSTRIEVVADGQGLEAAAREQRYGWLLSRCDGVLLTAHHRDDQTETLLLRLLRGAGVRGLGSIRAQSRRQGTRILRPLLNYGRNELENYARCFGLAWIDDPSNSDLRIDRNRIRHQVLAPLRRHWPHIDRAVARSAGYLQEAGELLDALGDDDLAGALAHDAASPLGEAPPVEITRLGFDSAPRIKNLLRTWICRRRLPDPPNKRLELAVQALFSSARRGHVDWPGGSLRRYRQYVYLVSESWLSHTAPLAPVTWIPDLTPDCEVALPNALGDVLSVVWQPATPQCPVIAHQTLAGRALSIATRRGAEVIKPAGHRQRRTLKNIFQQAGVPPWERERWPLIWHGDALVCVPGLVVSADYCAPTGEVGARFVPQAGVTRLSATP